MSTSRIRDHEPGKVELENQRQAAQQFSYQPLISFVTPVFNPPPDVLRAAIESVLTEQPITESQLPATGCNIKWKPDNAPSYFD